MSDHPLQLLAFFAPGLAELSVISVIVYILCVHRFPEFLQLIERLPRDPVKREFYLRRVRNWHQLHPPTARDYIDDILEILPIPLLLALATLVRCVIVGG